jgi:hypothetical protein
MKMTVLLITYDLNKPKQDYDAILDIIESCDCFFVAKSSYLVDVDDYSKFWEKIAKVIDKSTRIAVFPIETAMLVRAFPDSSDTKKFDDWIQARIH